MNALMPEVTVNGVTLSAALIGAEAQNHPAPKGKPGLAWRAAARALVTRELLLQQARAQKLVPAPVELAPGQVETEDEALIRQLLETAVIPAAVDDAGLRAIYDRAPDRFRAPSLYEAAHILFAAHPQDGPGREMARAQASAALAELQHNPRGFAQMAVELSACSSKGNGGMLGQLASGDTVPEFEAALATMEEGAISAQPVETRYGFHLIRLDARVRGEVLPFDAVLPHLREAQEKAEWVRASQGYVRGLVEAAEVTGIDLTPAPVARSA